MARKIVITSGKGGVGKTTICSNLGVNLAMQGKRVVMIDADIGLNNLDVIMNIETRVTYDLIDVLNNKCRLKQALVQDCKLPLLYILPCHQFFIKNNIDIFALKNIVQELDAIFDFVIIDCPAGLEDGFHRAVFCADEALVVVTPHLSSVRDADKIITVLSGYNLENISICINRVRNDLIQSKKMLDVFTIQKLLKKELLGVINEDDDFSQSVQKNYKKNNPFEILARNLITGNKEIFDYQNKNKFFFNFRNIFKL